MKINAEISGTVLSSKHTTNIGEIEGCADPLNPADYIEDFRDGKESTRYVNAKGPGGNTAAFGDSAEQLPSQRVDSEPALFQIVNGDVSDSQETSAMMLKETSTAEYHKKDTSSSSLLSEHFRDGPRSASSRSGSDVLDPIIDGQLPNKQSSAPGSSSGSSAPNERGSRMATFKDNSFNIDVDSTDKITSNNISKEALLLSEASDEDKGSVESMYQSIIDNAVASKLASSTQQKKISPAMATIKNIDTTKPPLLSIDPKSIAIIPLSKGKASEKGDNRIEDTEDVRFHNSLNLKSGTLLNDPVRSHEWDGLANTGSFVKMFRGSASYIANHRGTTAVYHIPGELLMWEGFPGLMDDIALTWLLGMKIVLVAGCRHQIDLRLEDIYSEEEYGGKGSSSLGGRVLMSSIRVTDEETLRVVKEEAGFVRFEVERRLAKSLR